MINLFEWIKKDPERLAKEIYYTPYARQVYEKTFGHIEKNSLYKAVNFCICCQMGYGIRMNKKVGWKNDAQGRERAYAARDWAELPERIIEAADRLRGVQIECRPAVELIQRFNYSNVLVYADPPYMLSTRRGKQYKCEMDNQAHSDLLDVLLAHKGPALISGYDSDLYNDRLRGWHREETSCVTRSRRTAREILWMNFEPNGRQMELKEFI